MKITAITRYKHGELFEVLRRLGWSQADLARRSGISTTMVASIINLNRRPSQKAADAIQKAFGEAGEYFDVLEQWPETFDGIKRGATKEETMDIPMECLIGCREAMMIPSPSKREEDGLSDAMNAAMDSLTGREKAVIEARFFEGKMCHEIGRQIGVSAMRVRQIEGKALRKLRHPSRSKHLDRFLNGK